MAQFKFTLYDINDRVTATQTITANSRSQAVHILEHSSPYDWDWYDCDEVTPFDFSQFGIKPPRKTRKRG